MGSIVQKAIEIFLLNVHLRRTMMGNVHLLELRLLETGYLIRFQNKKSRF